METNELKKLLKGIYELESLLFIYKKIEHLYQTTLERLENDRTSIYWFEEFANEGQEGDEPLNITLLTKNITEDSSYHRGNFFLLPLRWRTSELIEIIERNRKKINTNKQKHFLSNLFLNNLPQKRLEKRLRAEVVAFATKKHSEDLIQKDIWTTSRIASLTKEYNTEIIPNIKKLETSLNKLYSCNIIVPKYRNFISVSMLYQYIDTGRCTSLDGDDGAYHLFNHEAAKDIITDHFGSIIFERAKLTLSMPYAMKTVQQAENLLSAISASLGNIKKNSAYSAISSL